MKLQNWFHAFCLIGLAVIISGCERPAPPPAPETPQAPQDQPMTKLEADPVQRGKYLVTALACNDCHTPFKMGANGPEPDMSKMLSGHPESLTMPEPPKLPDGPWQWIGSSTNTAFSGPWGVTYSTNLTPDENTGIGIWDEEMFVNALRTGKHMGTSRPLMPPMPWQAYSQLNDEDLKAIFAYLRTVPAIANRVPDYFPPAVAAKNEETTPSE
jgi:Cytochrome c